MLDRAARFNDVRYGIWSRDQLEAMDSSAKPRVGRRRRLVFGSGSG
jgi:hypothetical protein